MPAKQPKRGRLWLNDGSCVQLRPEWKDHVRVLTERYRQTHNRVRPHSSLGYRPPAPETLLPVDPTPVLVGVTWRVVQLSGAGQGGNSESSPFRELRYECASESPSTCLGGCPSSPAGPGGCCGAFGMRWRTTHNPDSPTRVADSLAHSDPNSCCHTNSDSNCCADRNGVFHTDLDSICGGDRNGVSHTLPDSDCGADRHGLSLSDPDSDHHGLSLSDPDSDCGTDRHGVSHTNSSADSETVSGC